MEYKYLDRVNSPEDIKALSMEEAQVYCSEARDFLIHTVSKRGGHLASNLGAVELNVAIHRVFESPKDHIVFDVGHQAYVHKLITGRRDRFDTLRMPGGLSGFTLSRESEHDAFGAGHSSTSLSAALGLAEADKLSGKENYTVVVLGDGAYTGGMIHEAINNCKRELPLIVILNDNGMSISPNKGAFASYLSSCRTSKSYIGAKETTGRLLSKIPLVGKPLRAAIAWTKNMIKRLIFRPSYFEELGFYYIGSIDGNDLIKLEKALTRAKSLNKCVFVHVRTQKGKGYAVAETAPDEFHSVSGKTQEDSFHSEFGKYITALADNDDKIVAVTAGMSIGTGLVPFEQSHPSRFFDVGIAEEHATTFAAGLAGGGYKPYFAIYSTFLQRAIDNVIHDVALQGLPVRFIVDRAGLSLGDGATHHGIFDVSYLSMIPGIEIMSPISYSSLSRMLEYSIDDKGPIAIRYSNSPEDRDVISRLKFERKSDIIDFFSDFDPMIPPSRLFICYGSIARSVLSAKDSLRDMGIEVGVIVLERIRPCSAVVDYILASKDIDHIVFVEEGIKSGGVGMNILSEISAKCGSRGLRFDIAAIDNGFASPEHPVDLYDFVGLSPSKLIGYFMD